MQPAQPRRLSAVLPCAGLSPSTSLPPSAPPHRVAHGLARPAEARVVRRAPAHRQRLQGRGHHACARLVTLASRTGPPRSDTRQGMYCACAFRRTGMTWGCCAPVRCHPALRTWLAAAVRGRRCEGVWHLHCVAPAGSACYRLHSRGAAVGSLRQTGRCAGVGGTVGGSQAHPRPSRRQRTKRRAGLGRRCLPPSPAPRLRQWRRRPPRARRRPAAARLRCARPALGPRQRGRDQSPGQLCPDLAAARCAQPPRPSAGPPPPPPPSPRAASPAPRASGARRRP